MQKGRVTGRRGTNGSGKRDTHRSEQMLEGHKERDGAEEKGSVTR